MKGVFSENLKGSDITVRKERAFGFVSTLRYTDIYNSI